MENVVSWDVARTRRRRQVLLERISMASETARILYIRGGRAKSYEQFKQRIGWMAHAARRDRING